MVCLLLSRASKIWEISKYLQQSITNVWKTQPVSDWNASGPKPSQTPGWWGCCPCNSLLSWLLQNRIFQGSGHCKFAIHRTFWKWRAANDEEKEKVLLTGVTDDILLQYPEVYRPSLQVQLAKFPVQVWLSVKQWGCYHSARNVARSQCSLWTNRNTCVVAPYCACLLPWRWKKLQWSLEVKNLAPKHNRLDSITVYDIHKDKLNKLNRRQIAQQFIAANERRRITFGCFT